jgi:hypothetical protein
MTKTTLLIASTSLLLAGCLTASAQTTAAVTNASATTSTEPQSTSYRAGDEFGARQGDWEFTLGGSGGSNKDFDNSLGGVNFSVGYFLSDTLEVLARQSANYTNGSSGSAEYNGSTFVAIDQHFGAGRFRPFVGVNFGGLYGDNTNDTWAAGIEGGLKVHVLPQTFVFALVNYAWTFNDTDSASDSFDDGALLWTVGVGFIL